MRILRPSIILSLKTKLTGGVKYRRIDLESGTLPSGAEHKRWETDKIVEDPEEHKRASQVRNECRKMITDLCAETDFGCLCPVDREAELYDAIKRSRARADEHNSTYPRTRVEIYAIPGKISSPEEASRAVAEQMRGILEEINRQIDLADPTRIRNAVKRAQEIAPMLEGDQIRAVTDAIEGARVAARTIKRRVEKKGEEIGAVLADIQRGAIEKARFAFLDLDDTTPEIAGEPLPAVDARRFAVELDTSDDEPTAPESAPESSEAETVAAASA